MPTAKISVGVRLVQKIPSQSVLTVTSAGGIIVSKSQPSGKARLKGLVGGYS